MEKRFCSYCGAPLKDSSLFCPSCGARVVDDMPGVAGRYRRYDVYQRTSQPLPFSCLLAYIPCLFWIPLLTDCEDNRHRECANQGLWLTITFFLFGAILHYGGQAVFHAGYINMDYIVQLFHGWNIHSWIEKAVRIWVLLLGIQVAGTLFLYVPINGFCGVMRGLLSSRPHILPIFGRIHLIRYKHDEEAWEEA